MKKTHLIATALGILVLVGTAGLLAGCKHPDTSAPSGTTGGTPSGTTSGTQAHQYTCPMHSDVVSDKPGNCPKCGMELVEKQQ